MARYRGTTTQRGYGAAHQQARARALAAYQPGQACARCGQPIYAGELVDLGHVDGTAKQLYAGLEHRSCNRAAGARRKNQLARARRQPVTARPRPPWQPSRSW